MRGLVCATLVAFMCSLPAVALAKPVAYRGECRKLTNQIARYERDVEWAKERDNELWENATLAHIERLTDRRDRLCPELSEDMALFEFGKALGNFLNKAASAAARYFMGQL